MKIKHKIEQIVPYAKTKFLFIPFLILYIGIVILFSKSEFQGDETRYISFANNLLNGFYSPPPPNINLWNGPGYPIVLIPYLFLKLPLIAIKLSNAFFLYFSLILFNKSLSLYVKKNIAFSFSIILGSYIPFFAYLHLILTEIFTIFLITLLTYFLCLTLSIQGARSFRIYITYFITSFILSYLAMTKIVFGYVILTCIILFSLIYIIFKSIELKKLIIIFLLALVFCFPYLTYTYHLTGKFFYWGNSGGYSLYWMSNPNENEFGDWHPPNLHNHPVLIKNHKEFFEEISELTSIKKDEALKKKAIQNIINHPKKYFMNWLANIGRMLFSYPYSYVPLTSFLRKFAVIIPNMFILVFSIFLIYPTFKFMNQIPLEILALLIFGSIYFLGSSLISTFARQFFPIVPLILLWFAYMFDRFLKIQLKYSA